MVASSRTLSTPVSPPDQCPVTRQSVIEARAFIQILNPASLSNAVPSRNTLPYAAKTASSPVILKAPSALPWLSANVPIFRWEEVRHHELSLRPPKRRKDCTHFFASLPPSHTTLLLTVDHRDFGVVDLNRPPTLTSEVGERERVDYCDFCPT